MVQWAAANASCVHGSAIFIRAAPAVRCLKSAAEKLKTRLRQIAQICQLIYELAGVERSNYEILDTYGGDGNERANILAGPCVFTQVKLIKSSAHTGEWAGLIYASRVAQVA